MSFVKSNSVFAEVILATFRLSGCLFEASSNFVNIIADSDLEVTNSSFFVLIDDMDIFPFSFGCCIKKAEQGSINNRRLARVVFSEDANKTI
jgi:hypothetical protein